MVRRFALIVFLATPINLWAQTRELSISAPRFEIDLYASAHRFGSPQRGDRQDYGAGARVMNGLPIGLGLGVEVGWLRDEFDSRFVDSGPISFVQDLYFFSGQLEYAFRSGRSVRPYVGLGFGVVAIDSESRPEDLERDRNAVFPFVPATAGLLWLDDAADPRFGLRIGVRDNLVWYGDDGPRVVRPDDGAHSNLEFLGGIALFPGRLLGS